MYGNDSDSEEQTIRSAQLESAPARHLCCIRQSKAFHEPKAAKKTVQVCMCVCVQNELPSPRKYQAPECFAPRSPSSRLQGDRHAATCAE